MGPKMVVCVCVSMSYSRKIGSGFLPKEANLNLIKFIQFTPANLLGFVFAPICPAIHYLTTSDDYSQSVTASSEIMAIVLVA